MLLHVCHKNGILWKSRTIMHGSGGGMWAMAYLTWEGRYVLRFFILKDDSCQNLKTYSGMYWNSFASITYTTSHWKSCFLYRWASYCYVVWKNGWCGHYGATLQALYAESLKYCIIHVHILYTGNSSEVSYLIVFLFVNKVLWKILKHTSIPTGLK